MKSGWKRVLTACAGAVGAYVLMNMVAKKVAEDKDMDNKPCMILNCQDDVRKGQQNESKGRTGAYEGKVKPMIDRLLSFLGLVFLSPVFVIISLAIVINDPGPVLFTQKRVGKDKQFFMLHKFRSMKMKTPHDVPTHQLENPEQYITRIGKFLRKYSLDELPQIWDIFRGKMSIIGPRPALWNQDDLVAERDKYGANDILPGLTGWAQINGRDELEIADKARLDGEYAEKLRQGGMKVLFFDVKCFLGTVASVLKHDGVVEGGTGTSNIGRDSVLEGGTGEFHKKEAAGISVHDMYKLMHLPMRRGMENSDPIKKMLIVGSGSYIGNAVKDYLSKTGQYDVDELDAVNLIPDTAMFRGFDIVFYVAGIVHQKETKENEPLYYKVNRDLAVAAARSAKEAGVRYFILLSTMSVYGVRSGHISKDTKAVPNTHYGRSKLQADRIIWQMRDELFRVAILRPPMVYGKDCKGNYQLLRKFAMKSPVFLDVKNKRSMIYVENLCVFLKKIVDEAEEGIFFPQNDQYVCTSEMVKLIVALNGKKMMFLGGFGFLINHVPISVIKKVFGNLTYEMSEPIGTYDFVTSIKKAERGL